MNLFFFASLGVAILLYGVLRGLEAIIRYQRDLNRSTVLYVDGDAGTWTMERRRIRSNELQRGKDDDSKLYKLEGAARLNGDKGSLFMLHPRHGWNLRVPNDREVLAASPLMRALAISNPASYYQAEMRNDSRDALDANQEPEPWYGRLAPVLLIVGVIALGMIGYIVVKIQGAT